MDSSRPYARSAPRHLQPANVLLSTASDERAALKISDFGLARQAFAGDEHGGFSTRLGTVAYAAPELLDAQAHRDGARYVTPAFFGSCRRASRARAW